MSVTSQSPGVWLASDRIWSPSAETFLSACGPDGCAPVLDREACAAPECPGGGFVNRVAQGLADVPGWPTDYDGYRNASTALRNEPSLAALSAHFVPHPEHDERSRAAADRDEADELERRRHEESVRWVSRHREGDRVELALSADLATLADAGGSYAGGTASLGYVYLMHHRDAREDGGSGWMPTLLFGDVLGAELRVHALARLDEGQAARWMVAVGARPVLANRFEDSVLRMPSYWDLFMPEFGVIARDDMDTTWYVAWETPFSILLDHDVALDIAARVYVVDEWIELPADAPDEAEDPAEVILSLSVGMRLP